MQELATDRYKRIAYSICYNHDLREDFYHHCISETIASKHAQKAQKQGYLMQYFTTICRNQMYNKNSTFNKLYTFKTTEISENLQEQEQPNTTLQERILESDLQRYNNENERYIKQVVKIYLKEGSIRQASIVTGISRKTIKTIIDEYIRNFNGGGNVNCI